MFSTYKQPFIYHVSSKPLFILYPEDVKMMEERVGEYVNVRVAREAFVDQLNESGTVAHPGNGRDVVNSRHGGVIDELL